MSATQPSQLSNGEQSAESAVPVIPPRHWWLRRIVAGCAIALVLLFGLRIWWGAVAHARLTAELEHCRAAGRAIELDEIKAAPSDTQVNAATLLADAAAALTPELAQSRLIVDFGPDLGWLAQDYGEVTDLIEANREALALIRRARSAPPGHWPLRSGGPAGATAPNLAMGQVRLSRLAGLAAAHAHLAGQDDEALEFLHDHYVISTTIARTPMLLSGVMPGGSRPYASGTHEVLTPRLTVRCGNGGDSKGAAERQRVLALIAVLLDEAPLRRQLSDFLYVERTAQLDALLSCADGRSSFPYAGFAFPQATNVVAARVLTFPLRPMLELDAIPLIRRCTQAAEACSAPTWPEYVRRCPPDPQSAETLLAEFTRPVSRAVAPSHRQIVRAFFRALVSRRMVATALAIRLHEIEHGARPRDLSALVPDGLTAVPDDPFRADPGAIGYRADGELPVLYSVGLDGVDDGGQSPQGGFGPRGEEVGDIVLYLNGLRPRRGAVPTSAPAPSTQTAQDNQDVKNRQGDAGKDQSGQQRP